jgi:hypothetical protein
VRVKGSAIPGAQGITEPGKDAPLEISPEVQAAADEVLATFKPKYGQPFPIPADFEPHMPSLHREAHGEGGASIRAHLEGDRTFRSCQRIPKRYRGWRGRRHLARQ